MLGPAVPRELIPSWRRGFQSGPEQSRPRGARRSGALTARTALGQFRKKEWLDGKFGFRLSRLPTTNPEFPFIIAEIEAAQRAFRYRPLPAGVSQKAKR